MFIFSLPVHGFVMDKQLFVIRKSDQKILKKNPYEFERSNIFNSVKNHVLVFICDRKDK